MRSLLYYILVSLMLPLAACAGKGHSADLPPALAAIFTDTVNPYDRHVAIAPDEGAKRLRIRRIPAWKTIFNDSNHIHLAAAAAIGIIPPGEDDELWDLSRPLVRIASCPEYYVDRLTHSYPFLVPEAADLLSEIGRRFQDSLRARGGGAYRPKVTSVLRTPRSVRRLQRVNRNATQNSAHAYATTFDISHSKFICDSLPTTVRTFEDLKNLLAEILYDLRNEGRCYVKSERKQACFHITARPVTDTDSIAI